MVFNADQSNSDEEDNLEGDSLKSPPDRPYFDKGQFKSGK